MILSYCSPGAGYAGPFFRRKYSESTVKGALSASAVLAKRAGFRYNKTGNGWQGPVPGKDSACEREP